jgi:hypothetical protein
MTNLEVVLRDSQHSGLLSPGEAIAILGCCEKMHQGLTTNNVVHPDNFIIDYDTFAVEALDGLMKEMK